MTEPKTKAVPKWALRALDATHRGWYSDEDAARALAAESPFRLARELGEMVLQEDETPYCDIHRQRACACFTTEKKFKARALLRKLGEKG